MIRNTMLALLAGSTLIAFTAPAEAQQYMMRRTMPGARSVASDQPQQYTGTWTYGAWDTSGACISGKRTERQVSTCKASSAGVTNPSCQGAKPADLTRQTDCQAPLRCGAPYNGWVGGGHTSYKTLGTAADEAGMISLCQANSSNGAGLCTWQGPGNTVGYAVGTSTYPSGISNQPTWRVARCDP
jgi:hypothetical protein